MKQFIFSFFFIVYLLFSREIIAKNNGAESTALGGCGVTLNTVWSNLNNQAGLAQINNLIVGVGSENNFGMKELSTHFALLALPVSGGVFGLNINYTGFELYNETKIGLAFAKRLSNHFNVGVQIDYLSKYIAESANTNNSNKFTFEIGIQKKLIRNLILGAHVFNPIGVKLSPQEIIPTVFKIGLCYNANSNVNVFAEGELESEQRGSLKMGIDYRIIKQLHLRTGFSTNPSKNSFGVGYNINKIKIDIAVSRHQILGYSPQLSLSSAF